MQPTPCSLLSLLSLCVVFLLTDACTLFLLMFSIYVVTCCPVLLIYKPFCYSSTLLSVTSTSMLSCYPLLLICSSYSCSLSLWLPAARCSFPCPSRRSSLSLSFHIFAASCSSVISIDCVSLNSPADILPPLLAQMSPLASFTCLCCYGLSYVIRSLLS